MLIVGTEARRAVTAVVVNSEPDQGAVQCVHAFGRQYAGAADDDRQRLDEDLGLAMLRPVLAGEVTPVEALGRVIGALGFGKVRWDETSQSIVMEANPGWEGMAGLAERLEAQLADLATRIVRRGQPTAEDWRPHRVADPLPRLLHHIVDELCTGTVKAAAEADVLAAAARCGAPQEDVRKALALLVRNMVLYHRLGPGTYAVLS